MIHSFTLRVVVALLFIDFTNNYMFAIRNALVISVGKVVFKLIQRGSLATTTPSGC